MMKTIKTTLSVFMMFVLLLAGCSKDDDITEPEKPIPTISDVEIGLGNNEIGTIGADFHFNASILAGDKIDKVEIKILQRAGEQYSKKWKQEIVWEQYRGAKNVTIHKHFNIPKEAAEGKYDFLIIVHDENGTKLEEKRNITLYLEENLPVMPEITNMSIGINGKAIEKDVIPVLKKDDELQVISIVRGVKDDGKMYILLINKKHNHRPETINEIDFDKAIVLHVAEHKDKETVGAFSTVGSKMKIGRAEIDANKPQGNPISGMKDWESGTYEVAVIYTNTTYNMGVFKYQEIKLDL